MANNKSYMKKTIAKNRKQGRGLTKTFAFGGFEFDTPQEAIMNNNNAQAQATIDTMEDSGLKLMRNIGTGFNIAGQLVGKYGSMFAGAGGAAPGAAPGAGTPGGKMTGMQKLANTKFGKGIQSIVYASGGQVPVEVEGNEMGQLPNGMMLDFQGPSHEQGGIPIDLPAGTKIYSDRVSIDGKTMAQRKASRENKLNKLEKKIAKGDRVAKNTLDRYMLTAGKEEALDMRIQQMLNEADNNPEFAKGGLIKSGNKTYRNGREVHLRGNIVGTNQLDNILGTNQKEISGLPTDMNQYQWNPMGEDNIIGTKQRKITVNPTTGEISGLPLKTNRSDWTLEEDVDKFIAPPPTKPTYQITDKLEPATNPETIKPVKKPKPIQDNGFGVGELVPMIGNALGIYGNYKAGIADEKAYLQAKASQTANTNAYKHYGKEALKTLDESKLFAKQMGDIQRSEVELARKTATDQNRKTARGINTMRALDLASQAGANRLDMQAYAQEAKQIQHILGQEANLKQQIDQAVMSGEESRDLRDRDDKANLLNMQTRANISKGNMYSNIGKNINDMAENSAAMNAMNDAYTNFKYTPGGRLRSIPGNADAIDLVKDARANPSKYNITDAQAKLWGSNDAIWVNYLATNGLIQPKKIKRRRRNNGTETTILNFDKPEFVDDFVYTPPFEMMDRALKVNQEGMNTAIATANLFNNLNIDFIDDEQQRQRVGELIKKYAGQADDIAALIRQDPSKWRQQGAALSALKNQLAQDFQYGEIYRTQKNAENWKAYQAELEKIKDPIVRQALKDEAMQKWRASYGPEKEGGEGRWNTALYDRTQGIDRPDMVGYLKEMDIKPDEINLTTDLLNGDTYYSQLGAVFSPGDKHANEEGYVKHFDKFSGKWGYIREVKESEKESYKKVQKGIDGFWLLPETIAFEKQQERLRKAGLSDERYYDDEGNRLPIGESSWAGQAQMALQLGQKNTTRSDK